MDVPALLRLAFDALIVVIGVAYAAGQRRERLEARGIKSQLADHKAWMERHEVQTAVRFDEHARDTEHRFEAASERFSALTSKVQVLVVEQAKIQERLVAVDARLLSLETRHNHFVELGGHDRKRSER